MEKIINGEKVEIYELNGELRVRKNRCDMPLEDFESEVLWIIRWRFYKII